VTQDVRDSGYSLFRTFIIRIFIIQMEQKAVDVYQVVLSYRPQNPKERGCSPFSKRIRVLDKQELTLQVSGLA
jgi:hypothetical protein